MSDRRNPYLILGLDYGTGAEDAAAAFAQAVRRIRSSGAQPYTIEDVTWALHKIEQAETEPDASLDTYRVPADPQVYFNAVLDRGLPPVPLQPASATTGVGRRELASEALLAEIRHSLAQATQGRLGAAVVRPADPIPAEVGGSHQSSPRPPHATTAGPRAAATHYPAGWYSDPWQQYHQRWWDGKAWSRHGRSQLAALAAAREAPAGHPRSTHPVPTQPDSPEAGESATGFPAGWYQDPWGQAAQRWWDGTKWTTHLHRSPSSRPLAAAES